MAVSEVSSSLYEQLSLASTNVDDLLDEITPESVPPEQLQEALRLIEQATAILASLAALP